LRRCALCRSAIKAALPAIIEGLVNNNLNPEEVCKFLGVCE
jgi:hypothetical protein